MSDNINLDEKGRPRSPHWPGIGKFVGWACDIHNWHSFCSDCPICRFENNKKEIKKCNASITRSA